MVRPYDDAPDAEKRASAAADAPGAEGASPDEKASEADLAPVADASAEDGAKAAESAPDPIAAAAAAARAEAEKVRAAERARVAAPADQTAPADATDAAAFAGPDPDPAADPAPAGRPDLAPDPDATSDLAPDVSDASSSRTAAADDLAYRQPAATAVMPPQQEERVRPAVPRPARAAASYGTVEPARSRKARGGRRGIAVALVVVLLFAAAAGGAYWFFLAGKSEPAVSLDRGQRVTLTLTRAQQVLEGLSMEAPDLAQFRYVPTDNLVGPKFENVAVGDVVEQKEGDKVVATREVTADALFRNKGILLTVPVKLAFAYDEAGETWREGDLELGDMTAQPLSAPNATLIVEDLDALLAAYDPAVGTLFAGVAPKTSSRLTTEGGAITVALAKDEQVTEGEKQLIKHHNCSAQIAVTWSDTEGWVAKVDRLNDEVTVEDVTTAQPDGEDQEEEGDQGGEDGPVGQEGGRPEYGLKCSTGDLVELGGTVSGTPGALTFKPDGGLRLTLDGSQRDVWAMTLTLGEGIDANALVGRHVTVVGTIGSGTLAAEEVAIG